MSAKETILQELTHLSHHLGEEAREYVIIGEGNTSARIDSATFFVKASGSNLYTIESSGFVEINKARLLELLKGDPTDQDVTRVLMEARVAPDSAGRPSVETTLHAVLYELTDAQFIGHTHPIAVNVVVGSQYAADIARHIIPDAVVVLGPHMVYVPYVDPGIPLTREVYRQVQVLIKQYAEMPRVIWLQNHGLFALGQSAKQVENVTQMAVKHARVLGGARALGEPHWLSEHDIARLHTRPDEEVRRAKFK